MLIFRFIEIYPLNKSVIFFIWSVSKPGILLLGDWLVDNGDVSISESLRTDSLIEL